MHVCTGVMCAPGSEGLRLTAGSGHYLNFSLFSLNSELDHLAGVNARRPQGSFLSALSESPPPVLRL